ncbi:hypothetical protein E2C01_052267 [Portunus trituberculatus]|uniref:Uncharacterized protein n=1 Tax=Portunus trituberculatus TaxID=210409 RepID=A0A5B7GDZ4_PORTR|nr:hypothetical protein [Portunus trituberculatus]
MFEGRSTRRLPQIDYASSSLTDEKKCIEGCAKVYRPISPDLNSSQRGLVKYSQSASKSVIQSVCPPARPPARPPCLSSPLLVFTFVSVNDQSFQRGIGLYGHGFAFRDQMFSSGAGTEARQKGGGAGEGRDICRGGCSTQVMVLGVVG